MPCCSAAMDPPYCRAVDSQAFCCLTPLVKVEQFICVCSISDLKPPGGSVQPTGSCYLEFCPAESYTCLTVTLWKDSYSCEIQMHNYCCQEKCCDCSPANTALQFPPILHFSTEVIFVKLSKKQKVNEQPVFIHTALPLELIL